MKPSPLPTLRFDDPAPMRVASMLSRLGYSTRVVGGAVRDSLAGKVPKDIDLGTDALPEAVTAAADAAGVRWIGTGLRHGTVTLVVEGRPYEVTTLRRDLETDGRHATVEFVDDFRTDAARRDFTINAMSCDMDGRLHDYFGGLEDLEARRVRFVGDARDRMREDHLRILRFFRFRLGYGGNEDGGVFRSVSLEAAGLEKVSVERVWSEMKRMLASPAGVDQVPLMERLGVCGATGFAPAGFHTARSAASAGAPPAAVLGMLSGGNAAEMASRWKLSTAETAQALTAEAVIEDGAPDPSHWRRAVASGMDADVAAAVLAATGREAAAAAARIPVPDFPLRGRDLVDAGFLPGPDLGVALAAARRDWMDGGFAATREDLLAGVIGALAEGTAQHGR